MDLDDIRFVVVVGTACVYMGGLFYFFASLRAKLDFLDKHVAFLLTEVQRLNSRIDKLFPKGRVN